MGSSNTKLLDDDVADEKIAAAAFSMPTEGRELATAGGHRGGPIVERIITAQPVAVPRDDGKILQKLKALATAAGDDWYYRFPVKDKGATKSIEGPSIKCANNVARLYGNCEIDTRALDNGDTWIIYARFIDWETGFSMTRPFEQSKGQQTIKTENQARAQQNAFQIGVSKAIRNVVCNALEQFTTFAFEEARKNIVEKVGKKLPEYRERVLAALKELKVDAKRVEATLGRPSKDWLADDVAKVIAEIQAIRDGMATIDETWPPEGPARPTRAQFAEGQGQPSQSQQQGEGKPAADPSTRAQDKPAAAAEEPAKPELTIIDMDGEINTLTSVPMAIDLMFNLIGQAEKRGADAVKGLEESNEGLLVQLRDMDLADIANSISKAFAKAVAGAAKPAQQRGQTDLLSS
jgi:hypothetical protein